MNFKDLLQKYKDGTATEEERRLVEEEIEKNELINDYLSQQLESLAPIDWDSENERQDVKKIRSAVNKRLWAMVVAVTLIIVSAAALINYVALPLYDKQFYDPLAAIENVPDLRKDTAQYYEQFSPLFLSAQTFINLHCPGWTLYDAQAEKTGLGEYEVHFGSSGTMDGQKDFTCRLSKGEQVQGIDKQWFFNLPVSNAFYDRGSLNTIYIDKNGNEHYEQQEDIRAMYRDGLNELPESSWVSAYISFPEDISLDELFTLQEQWEDCNISWAAVRTEKDNYFEAFGINISGGGYVIEATEEFEEKFPYFCLSSIRNSDKDKAFTYEERFKSMLRYMSYQDDFLNAFCDVNGFGDSEIYDEALSYVEENGIRIYGAYIEGKKAAISALEQSDICHSFMLDDIKISNFG